PSADGFVEAVVQRALDRVGFEGTVTERALGTFIASADLVAPGVAMLFSHAAGTNGEPTRSLVVGVAASSRTVGEIASPVGLLFVVAAVGGDASRARVKARSEIALL